MVTRKFQVKLIELLKAEYVHYKHLQNIFIGDCINVETLQSIVMSILNAVCQNTITQWIKIQNPNFVTNFGSNIYHEITTCI